MTTPFAPASRGRWWIMVGIACVLFKLWLVAAQPVVAIAGAGHDDRLYLQLASSLLNGEWLGAYNQMTLAKGPMYSVWIAGTMIAGIPLPLANHLLYLAGCFVLIRALRPWLPSDAAAWVLFLLLWWNPMTYEMPVLGRVLRQNFYTPAALFLFAGCIALETRRAAAFGIRIAWGSLLGISGAALWLTREESAWAVPSVILLVAVAAWMSWRAGMRLRPLIAPLIAAALCAGVMMTTVCTLNLRYYGWFGTVEYRAPAFIEAYGALQRIIPSREISHWVPVTREARDKAYAMSPAFSKLRPHLEGDIGLAWARASESWIGVAPEAREIGGGWFMWALRDAVRASGHAENAGSALAFYQQIANEVNAACDAGLVPARPRRDTLMPPWRTVHTTRLIGMMPEAFAYFFTFRGFVAFPPPSTGTAPHLQLFRDLTRWHLSPSPEAPELDRPHQQKLDERRMSVLWAIGKTLRWTVAAGAFTAIGGWLWLLWRTWRGRAELYRVAVATAALGGAAAVVIVNTLVDVLAFPNRSPGSFAQAYPLLLLFTALVWIELIYRPTRRQSALSQPASSTPSDPEPTSIA